MQKRYLVPLDGSPLADRIVTQLKRLLVASDVEAVLLTVVAPDPDAAALARKRQDALDHLNGVRDALVEQGALASVEVVVGDPVEQISERAAKIGAELVVMASHGRSGLSRFVRGSVAENVIRRSTVPVLVANPRAVDTAAATGELAFQRILVPLDGSDVALDVLPLAETVAKRYGAEVLLLRVTAPPAAALVEGAYYPPMVFPSPHETAASLEPVRQRLAAQGIRARTLSGLGPEALEIVDIADREQVDLVVMSTHGRSGVSRWLFGSVAEQVLRHCTRPLLVRRVQQAQEEAARPLPTPPATLSGRELIGAKVKDLTLADLGTVEDVVIDPATARVTYAVLRFGGILGIGEKFFPVPWSRLHWRPGDHAFVLQHHGKPRDQLAHAPHVTKRPEKDHTWIQQMAPAVHSFYPGPRL